MTFHIFNYALNSHIVNVLSHRNNYHYSEKVVAQQAIKCAQICIDISNVALVTLALNLHKLIKTS